MLEKLLDAARNLGWSVTVDSNTYAFQRYSPCGQDFYFELNATDESDLFDQLDSYIDGFDVSYETYIWLDSEGHGRNGAPYDMLDVYNDMNACLTLMKELLGEWEDLI